MLDVKKATTAELLAFYNANSGKDPVKRFSDRATAEKRVSALLEALPTETPAQAIIRKEQEALAAEIKVHKARKSAPKVEVDTDSMSDPEFEAYVKGNLGKPEEAAPGARRSNSAGIALSWNNPEVFAARMTRNSVVVVGHGSYKSVREAFGALNLPDSKHIRFRMKLKAEKVAIFEWAGKSYEFQIM